jgi:cytidine deaminase
MVCAAVAARERAYAPYSGYKVGAAVLGASEAIYVGCNVENVSFGLTVCAERVAVGNAIAGGEDRIVAVAVVAEETNLVRPCGACLQVMAEFSDADDPLAVICAALNGSSEIRPLSEYLPIQFYFDRSGGN